MTLHFAANSPVVSIVQLMKVSGSLAKIARTVETNSLNMFSVFCPVCFIVVDMCISYYVYSKTRWLFWDCNSHVFKPFGLGEVTEIDTCTY